MDVSSVMVFTGRYAVDNVADLLHEHGAQTHGAGEN